LFTIAIQALLCPRRCRNGDRPVLKPRALAPGTKCPLDREQDGASSVRQHAPKVDIAAHADATEMPVEATRSSARVSPSQRRDAGPGEKGGWRLISRLVCRIASRKQRMIYG
jgi:hypothetical protein